MELSLSDQAAYARGILEASERANAENTLYIPPSADYTSNLEGLSPYELTQFANQPEVSYYDLHEAHHTAMQQFVAALELGCEAEAEAYIKSAERIEISITVQDVVHSAMRHASRRRRGPCF